MTASADTAAVRDRRTVPGLRPRLAVLAVWLLPLVVWPGLERPFSTPKLTLLVVATAALFVPGPRRGAAGDASARLPRSLAWFAIAWAASFAAAALLGPLPALPDVVLGLVAPAFAWAVLSSGAPTRRIVAAQVGTAAVVAVVALLQWRGLDLLAWWGWRAPVDGLSVRMRVHATLGNPNFVGALMATTAPLAAALVLEAWRGWRSAVAGVALVLLAAALVATGSRGAVLGLGVAGLAWAGVRGSRRAVVAVCVVLVVGAIAIWQSPARPLQTTFEGRLYLWQVVGPHAAARPIVGLGPGAVALRFPAWQREADAAGQNDPRFRGLTDHVHNDYLEALVERGVVGLCTLLAPLVWVVGTAVRRRPYSPLGAGALASMLALATCALVDFPLARPVELTWWWLALGLVLTTGPSDRR